MSVFQIAKSPYWQYSFDFKGRRYQGSTGQTGRRAAERFEQRLRRELAEPAGSDLEDITLDVALDRYFEHHIEGKSSEATVLGHMRHILDHLGDDTFLSEISSADLVEYIGKARKGVSDSTANRRLEVIRATWRFAEHTIGANTGRSIDWRSLRLKEPQKRTRHLSAAEEKRLMLAIRPDYRAFIAFAILSGFRLGNIIDLKWADLDFDAGKARLTLKGGKIVNAALGKQALLLIEDQPRAGDHVFTYICERASGDHRVGHRYPITRWGWRRVWARALKAAQIRDFRFHDLRHTFATRLLSLTGNLGLTSEALGHSDVSTTQRYAHVLDEDLTAGLDQIAAIDVAPDVADAAQITGKSLDRRRKRILKKTENRA